MSKFYKFLYQFCLIWSLSLDIIVREQVLLVRYHTGTDAEWTHYRQYVLHNWNVIKTCYYSFLQFTIRRLECRPTFVYICNCLQYSLYFNYILNSNLNCAPFITIGEWTTFIRDVCGQVVNVSCRGVVLTVVGHVVTWVYSGCSACRDLIDSHS